MGNTAKPNEEPGSSEWIRMQKNTQPQGGAETNVEGVVNEEDEEEDIESLNTRDTLDENTESDLPNPVSH